MTKSESRIPKEGRSSNVELLSGRRRLSLRHSDFGFSLSFGFVIRHSYLSAIYAADSHRSELSKGIASELISSHPPCSRRARAVENFKAFETSPL